MRRVLLVTAREYRRMVTLPAFWMVALIVPVVVIVVPLVQKSLGRSRTAGYVLVDQSGRYRAQIDRRIELDYQREVLVQLLDYAKEWRTADAAPLNAQRPLQTGASSSRFADRNFRLLAERSDRGAPGIEAQAVAGRAGVSTAASPVR